jgi:hypothetical protein
MTEGSAYGEELLVSLLRLADRRSDNARPSVEVRYARLHGAVAEDTFEAYVNAAFRAGAIEPKRMKTAQHMIERLRLVDAERLAGFLGRSRYADIAEKALAVARDLAGDHGWIHDLIEKTEQRWRLGDKAWAMDANDLSYCRERFIILRGLADGISNGLDPRTFSVRLFPDRETDGSKVFEWHRGQVLLMLRDAHAIDGGTDDDVLGAFGLMRFPHLVLLRGPVRVVDPSGLSIPGTMAPYVGVHAEWASALSWSPLVVTPRILTIENLTSFNRHVREVCQDDVCVVYTGGFPSACTMTVLRRLIETAPVRPTLHHWGDIDLGGLRIAEHIRSSLDTEVTLHAMTRDLLIDRGRSHDAKVPGRLKAVPGPIGELACVMEETARLLEQELVDPLPIP